MSRSCYNNFLLVVLLLASIFQAILHDEVWDGFRITQAEYLALQVFKDNLIDHSGILQSWNDSNGDPCSGGWIGIKCFRGHVISIQLPGKGLGGQITENIGQFKALARLSLHDNNIGGVIPISLGFLHNLRQVFLFNNKLSGSIPPSLGTCPLLKILDVRNNLLTGYLPPAISNSSSLILLALQYNKLSGSIPDNWGGISQSNKLKNLTLDHNSFSNSIPMSLSKLTQLEEISLSHNQINGTIPIEIGSLSELKILDLSQNSLTGGIPASLTNLTSLISFNVSYNELSGPVPFLLSNKFNSTSFFGNLQLCGYNVSTPCPSASPALPPSQVTMRNPRPKLDKKDILIIVMAIFPVVLLLFLCISWVRKRASVTNGNMSTADTGIGGEVGGETVITIGSAVDTGTRGEVRGELVHFDGQLIFTSDDLHKKTDGVRQCTYGTTYKVTLEDGSEVTVISLEKIAKNKREFAVEVTALGKIRHPNLLALRAYYLGSRGEKLLVFDFMPRSLTSFFHARRPDTPIDWQTRMNITKDITRGLRYLHIEKNIVHGNLTSSNILLDDNNNSKIADYGLSQLITTDANSNVQGYHAPELSELNMANTMTDIYSLGVIMLELLTGRRPDGVDLPRWVTIIVKEDWTENVFDQELMRDASITRHELFNTLRLARNCVDSSPNERPKVQLVLQQLKEIKPELC